MGLGYQIGKWKSPPIALRYLQHSLAKCQLLLVVQGKRKRFLFFTSNRGAFYAAASRLERSRGVSLYPYGVRSPAQ